MKMPGSSTATLVMQDLALMKALAEPRTDAAFATTMVPAGKEASAKAGNALKAAATVATA